MEVGIFKERDRGSSITICLPVIEKDKKLATSTWLGRALMCGRRLRSAD